MWDTIVYRVTSENKQENQKEWSVDIQEKKELLKLLGDYQDETMQKAWSLKTLKNNPYTRKSNEIERIVYYLYLDIIGSNL